MERKSSSSDSNRAHPPSSVSPLSEEAIAELEEKLAEVQRCGDRLARLKSPAGWADYNQELSAGEAASRAHATFEHALIEAGPALIAEVRAGRERLEAADAVFEDEEAAHLETLALLKQRTEEHSFCGRSPRLSRNAGISPIAWDYADTKSVVREAADVANFAMMIADVCERDHMRQLLRQPSAAVAEAVAAERTRCHEQMRTNDEVGELIAEAVKVAVVSEREACARECDAYIAAEAEMRDRATPGVTPQAYRIQAAANIARRIRARADGGEGKGK